MKAKLLVLLALSLVIASCQLGTVQKVANVCKTSCDDVISKLGRASNSLDDALRVGASQADEAGKLFSATDNHFDELSRTVSREVAVGEVAPYQITDDILRSSNQSRSHLDRLKALAEEYGEEIDFFGEFVCEYRKEVIQSLTNQGGLTPGQVNERWGPLKNDLEQNQINPWDASINLFCTMLEIKKSLSY